MEEQLNAFLEFLQQERNYSENTTAAYKNDLSQFLKFLRNYSAADIQDWNDISVAVVDDYVTNIKAQSYASSSIARKVAALKSFFHFLYARGAISQDPTASIDSPKVKKRLPQTLSMDEVDRLLAAPAQKNAPKNLRDTALLQLLYATGMRVTELVSLSVSDLNLEENTLTCVSNEEERRSLPFDDVTQQILERYLVKGRPHLVKDKEETALFLNHRGQQLTRQGLWLIIKTYARQARLDAKVTPHTLRHSFAAHKLNSGSNLQEIQKLLGHANISTTQIYTQLADEEE